MCSNFHRCDYTLQSYRSLICHTYKLTLHRYRLRIVGYRSPSLLLTVDQGPRQNMEYLRWEIRRKVKKIHVFYTVSTMRIKHKTCSFMWLSLPFSFPISTTGCYMCVYVRASVFVNRSAYRLVEKTSHWNAIYRHLWKSFHVEFSSKTSNSNQSSTFCRKRNKIIARGFACVCFKFYSLTLIAQWTPWNWFVFFQDYALSQTIQCINYSIEDKHLYRQGKNLHSY